MNQNHAHIHREWHRAASGRDIPALIALYAEDAILESPLVPAILSDKPDGMLRGKREIRESLEAGALSRPIDLIRWHRSDTYFSAGNTPVSEDTPQPPEGDRVEIMAAVGHN